MNASTATAKTPLRQAWPWFYRSQAGRLAPRDLNILFQVCLDPSGLRMPVSPGVLAVSSLDGTRDPELVDGSRTIMNNTGYASFLNAFVSNVVPASNSSGSLLHTPLIEYKSRSRHGMPLPQKELIRARCIKQ